MESWRTSSQLPVILDVLGLSESDPAVRRLADSFGGHPVMRERLVGEPARRSRRLLFASGAEIIVHNDAIVAVLLHLTPTPAAPRGLELSAWIPTVDNAATLDDLADAVGTPPRFAGVGTPYFTLDGGYARASFDNNRGWNQPGNLVGLTFTIEQPGLACRPEDDDCPSCSDLLVRSGEPDGGIDVDKTHDSLAAVLTTGGLTEDAHWVKLADLRQLHASGLMARVECQLTCTTCRRIICFTLFRDSSPTFGYYVLNDARRRPREPIPPLEQERDAMHYVDHEPGAWFLVEQQSALYLDARYSHSAIIDDSALIRLDESEIAAYRGGGHDYLSVLAQRIHNSAPYRDDSAYYARNLYRSSDGSRFRDDLTAAIANHTWLQHRP